MQQPFSSTANSPCLAQGGEPGHFGNSHRTQGRLEPQQSAALVALGCLLLFTTTLWGQSGPEPGKTDPMGAPAARYDVFPDQGIGVLEPKDSAGYNVVFYRTDSNTNLSLNDSTAVGGKVSGEPYNQLYAATGRIDSQSFDDLAIANRKDSSIQVAVRNKTGGVSHTSILPEPLLNRMPDSGDFLSLAAGDLDRVPDGQGNNHDEVVAAYASGLGGDHIRYYISVINYSSGQPVITTSDPIIDRAPIFTYEPASGAGKMLPSSNIIGVTIGDFDGDGNNEIALAALSQTHTLLLYTYRYRTDANNNHTLSQLNSYYYNFSGDPLVGSIAVRAGDFTGKGYDDLAIAYAKWDKQVFAAGLDLIHYESNFRPSTKLAQHWIQGTVSNNQWPSFQRPRLELAAGQFLLNAQNVFGRRQVALAVNDATTGSIRVHCVRMADDLQSLAEFGSYQAKPSIEGNGPPGQAFSLAAGGFMGYADNNQPLSSLALTFWTQRTGLNSSYYTLLTLKPSTSGLTLANQKSVLVQAPLTVSVLRPVVAYDLDGKSGYLGAPVRIKIPDMVQTDFIMEEPPKHAYWDEAANTVVNMTRFSGNNVTLSKDGTASFSGSSTDTSSIAAGQSNAASAGATVTVGGGIGIFQASASASADVTKKTTSDYSENKATYNKNFEKRTLSSTGQTNSDDYLKGREQTFNIWRYRIYGGPASNGLNSFFELVFPGPMYSLDSGGLSKSWYQPIHENGNILSYPRTFGGPNSPLIPADAGTYTLQNGAKGNGPQIPASQRFFDGASGSDSLEFQSQLSTGSSFDSSHQLSDSLDIRIAFKAEASFWGSGVEARADVQAETHRTESWGSAVTSDAETTATTKVVLNKIEGTHSYAYPFFPVLYTTLDGTLKMAFSVPNPADTSNHAGGETYATLYGGKPDPALNLPFRFDVVGSDWQPSLAITRKKMRGLFLRKPDLNLVTNTYDFLADNVSDGDTVRIEPRIYNYSTGQPVNNVPVVFQVIPYDSKNNSEICAKPIYRVRDNAGAVCPATARTTIGETTINHLDPLQFTCLNGTDEPAVTGCAPSVHLNWKTSGFSELNPGDRFRLYVVVDPDNSINQTYPAEGPPVAIAHVTNASPMVVTTAAPHGFATGNWVTIGGVEGLPGSNGIFQVTYETPTSFSLTGTIAGGGSYSSGGLATILDPGQNNEGFGYISVGPKSIIAASGEPLNYYFNANSMAAVSYRGEVGVAEQSIIAYQGRPLPIRVMAFSSTVNLEGARVLLFDGDPAAGGVVVADQPIYPGEKGPEGSAVWIDWTPAAIGMHDIYAVLVDAATTVPEQPHTQAHLDVNVLAAGDMNGDGKVDQADINLLETNIGRSVEASSCGMACDLDGDGRITARDAHLLIQIAGTSTQSQ